MAKHDPSREGHVTAETANTPARRLYFCVQMMYLKNDIPKYALPIWLRQDCRGNARLARSIDVINIIFWRALYKALKEKELIKVEEELRTIRLAPPGLRASVISQQPVRSRPT